MTLCDVYCEVPCVSLCHSIGAPIERNQKNETKEKKKMVVRDSTDNGNGSEEEW